jgi:hypothetical protein
MLTIVPLDHERAEWLRVALAAYSRGHVLTGRRFTEAAAAEEVGLEQFDVLQRAYRAWLTRSEFPLEKQAGAL